MYLYLYLYLTEITITCTMANYPAAGQEGSTSTGSRGREGRVVLGCADTNRILL